MSRIEMERYIPNHPTIQVKLPDWMASEDWTSVDLDIEIAPMVQSLWKMGFFTNVSCQGDNDHWAHIGFVDDGDAIRFVMLLRNFPISLGEDDSIELMLLFGPFPTMVRFPPQFIPKLTTLLNKLSRIK